MDDEFRKDLKWSAVWAALTVVLAVVAAIGWSYNDAYVLLIFLSLITGFAALFWAVRSVFAMARTPAQTPARRAIPADRPLQHGHHVRHSV
jgi:hypothetical protein